MTQRKILALCIFSLFGLLLQLHRADAVPVDSASQIPGSDDPIFLGLNVAVAGPLLEAPRDASDKADPEFVWRIEITNTGFDFALGEIKVGFEEAGFPFVLDVGESNVRIVSTFCFPDELCPEPQVITDEGEVNSMITLIDVRDVPEPASLGILGIGILALLGLLRRRALRGTTDT
jgi:hypothetical protein